MYAENPLKFNKTYRICIAHTEQDIPLYGWVYFPAIRLVLSDWVTYYMHVNNYAACSNRTKPWQVAGVLFHNPPLIHRRILAPTILYPVLQL